MNRKKSQTKKSFVILKDRNSGWDPVEALGWAAFRGPKTKAKETLKFTWSGKL